MSRETLTLEERWAITQLGRAWDAFLALPVMHPDDQREFRALIHHAQDKVLARVAMRQLQAEIADGKKGLTHPSDAS